MFSRLSAGLKKSRFWVNDIAYSLKLKKISPAPGKRILIYHGVTENANKKINSRFISTKEFEEQLIYFKNHFRVLPLNEYFITPTEKLDPFTISITFDDGYLNNLTEALPLLEKHQIPASFFITTIRQAGYDYLWADLLDLFRYTGPNKFQFKGLEFQKGKSEYTSKSGTLKQMMKNSNWALKKELKDFILSNNSFINDKEWFPYFKLMNEVQIKQLASSDYATVGSHALYHNCLSRVSIKEASEALSRSKSYLEKLTDKEVNYFAYPDGDYNENLSDLVEKAGYTKQLVVDYNKLEHKQDKRLAERFGINPYIRVENQIQCIINGRY